MEVRDKYLASKYAGIWKDEMMRRAYLDQEVASCDGLFGGLYVRPVLSKEAKQLAHWNSQVCGRYAFRWSPAIMTLLVKRNREVVLDETGGYFAFYAHPSYAEVKEDHQHFDSEDFVGTCAVKPDNERGPAEIYSLRVNPEYRNAGCAKTMVRYCESIAFKNFDRVTAKITIGNMTSQRLFERMGYVAEVCDLGAKFRGNPGVIQAEDCFRHYIYVKENPNLPYLQDSPKK